MLPDHHGRLVRYAARGGLLRRPEHRGQRVAEVDDARAARFSARPRHGSGEREVELERPQPVPPAAQAREQPVRQGSWREQRRQRTRGERAQHGVRGERRAVGEPDAAGASAADLDDGDGRRAAQLAAQFAQAVGQRVGQPAGAAAWERPADRVGEEGEEGGESPAPG
jgi:hypothetical protein